MKNQAFGPTVTRKHQERKELEESNIDQIEERGIQNIAIEGPFDAQSVKRGEHVNGASAFPEPLNKEKEGKELLTPRDPGNRVLRHLVLEIGVLFFEPKTGAEFFGEKRFMEN